MLSFPSPSALFTSRMMLALPPRVSSALLVMEIMLSAVRLSMLSFVPLSASRRSVILTESYPSIA